MAPPKNPLNDQADRQPGHLGLPGGAGEVQRRDGHALIPLLYVRNNDYVFGSTINSCESYVYRSFFDTERWIDGLSACPTTRAASSSTACGHGQDDRRHAARIARNDLQDIDGHKIVDRSACSAARKIYGLRGGPLRHQVRAAGGHDQERVLRGHGDFFPPDLVADFERPAMARRSHGLVNELHRGAVFYRQGPATPVSGGVNYADPYDHSPRQGFYDEWEFHKVMTTAPAASPTASSQEYRRRQNLASAAFDLVMDKTKCLWENASWRAAAARACPPPPPGAPGRRRDAGRRSARLPQLHRQPRQRPHRDAARAEQQHRRRRRHAAASAFTLNQILAGQNLPGQSFLSATSHLSGVASVARARANVASASPVAAALVDPADHLSAARQRNRLASCSANLSFSIKQPQNHKKPGETEKRGEKKKKGKKK